MSFATLPVSSSPEDVEFVLVKTTLPVTPLPPNTARLPIVTDRLIIRPWLPTDFDQIRILRLQPEVMQYTRVGHIDLDEAETQAWLARFLPPGDAATHSCAITLKETGEVIGTGGTHSLQGNFGWPEVGYMFRKEFWGKGYATEFLRAYMKSWAELPREEVEIKVDPRTVTGDGVAEEQLIAVTAIVNEGSQKVLRKCGWEHFVTWPGDDSSTLPTFRFFPCRKEVS
ncbi:acyl-CoA N-acyltransferase [Coniochaeta ligniaria NRRL 30616]|uniref:Acyl-CoA N-acyltransferase n=1 Tax=Coniochaeta ligniaria NRRL 30616 TaxID=1408157 RepID=A0A1J7JEY3_9PEZI|nr:acyl-CoA N-acyltransferase [Coniochaeta ligniaria NRRL 30616]